jgi:hypothetical protein
MVAVMMMVRMRVCSAGARLLDLLGHGAHRADGGDDRGTAGGGQNGRSDQAAIDKVEPATRTGMLLAGKSSRRFIGGEIGCVPALGRGRGRG